MNIDWDPTIYVSLFFVVMILAAMAGAGLVQLLLWLGT